MPGVWRPVRAAIVAAILTCAAAGDLAPQAGTIRGRVVRADGPVVVTDAELLLRPSGATTRSDAAGEFEFLAVSPGLVELVARRAGYVTATRTLTLPSGAMIELDIALESVAATLDPIVTTIARDPRSLADVAGTISVVDSAKIHRARSIGLREALRSVPGLQVASRYGTDDENIGIRGSAARSRQAVRGVAVLLDGVPITEPDGVARLDLIDLAAVRQIEVLRGPASAIHAGSPSGVVNVVSRTGRDSPGIAARVQRGAFGLRKYRGRAGTTLADGRAGAFVAASHTAVEGHRAHSDADLLRGQVALDYEPGSGTRVAIEAAGSRLDARLPGSLTQAESVADPRGVAPPAAAFGFGRGDRRFRIGGRGETRLGGSVAGAYLFYGGRTLRFPIPSQIVDGNFHRVQAGARLRAGWIGPLPIRSTIGFDYDHVYGTDHRWANDAGSRGALLDDGRDAARGLGAYAEAEWSIDPAVTGTLGLRHDRIAYRFQSTFPGAIPRQDTAFELISPRVALVWRPTPSTSIHGSVGRGFEVPAFGELSPSPGAPIGTVRPKSLWNHEVGARLLAARRFLVEAAVFVATVRGEFVPVTVGGASLPENASRSRNVGVELGVMALATPWLDVGASYSFLDLRLQEYSTFVLDSAGTRIRRDFSGKSLPAVPRHRLTADGRIRPIAGLEIGVEVEWQGVVYVETGNADRGIWYVRQQPEGPVVAVPFRAVRPRALAHLNATYHIGPLRLFGNVENLFGQRYTANVVANEFAGRFYEPGSPAWVSVGIGLAGLGAAGT